MNDIDDNKRLFSEKNPLKTTKAAKTGGGDAAKDQCGN